MPVAKKKAQPKKLFNKASKLEFNKQIIAELYEHGEYVDKLKREIDKMERSRNWWRKRAEKLQREKLRY